MVVAATNIAINIPFPSASPAHAQQASFSNPIPIDNGAGAQDDSHVAASSSNNVYVSYSSEPQSGNSNVLLARSSDGGTSFNTPHTTLSNSGFSFLSAVAANGNDVYAVWTGGPLASDIYLAKSTDGGVTFGSPVQVEHGDNDVSPEIAVSGDTVYVIWEKFNPSTSVTEIFGAVSTDGGQTFSSAVDISNTPGTLSKNPSIAASGNNEYVVWTDCNTDGTNCKILYSKSNDGGVTFATSVTLTDVESSLPDISVQGSTVYIVYGRVFLTPQNVQDKDIFLIKGTDTSTGSTNFGNPFNLSNDPQFSNNPRIDTSGSNIVVQWEDFDPTASTPHFDVVAVGSTDGGATFGSRTSATSNSFPTEDSTLNDVAISGNKIYSTWSVRNIDPETFDVYFAKGTLTPATTPAEGIQKLIDTINGLPVAKGTKTSLLGPLHNAVNLLTDNDPTNDASVCSKLDSFLSQVDAKAANGQLTPQQAADLRQQATAIETSLGCPSTLTTITTATNNNNKESTSSTSSAIEKQQEQALINLRNLAENNALSSTNK
jgi:hypothetical protein